MKLEENFKLAFYAIVDHKFRSFLTMLGIIFGVASVIAMLSIGEGAKKLAIAKYKELGVNNIIIRDNDVRNASGAGVICVMGAHYHPIFPKDANYGRLLRVEVMRNRLVNTGFRGSNARWDSLPARNGP